MRELFKNLMNLDKPVLTEKLAPKIAPYAKIIYLVVLVILGLSTLGTLGLLLVNTNTFVLGIRKGFSSPLDLCTCLRGSEVLKETNQWRICFAPSVWT